MTLLNGNVRDQALNPVIGASIYVYGASGTLLTLYDALDDEITNPLTSGMDGYYEAYVNEDWRKQEITYGGRIRYIEAAGEKGDPGANVMAIGLFYQASGLSIPNGTNIVQTAGNNANGVGVGSYVYDAAVDAAFVTANPLWSFISANGRGFRLIPTNGTLYIYQFGADGSGAQTNPIAAQNNAAMLAIMNCGRYYKNTPEDDAYYISLPRIEAGGVGEFWMGTNSLPFGKWGNLEVIGLGNADAGTGTSPTSFSFAANTIAFQIENFNTDNGTVHGPPYKSGSGVVIEGWAFRGGSGTNILAHGCVLRAPCTVRNNTFTNFAGSGIRVIGTSGGGGYNEGGPNLCVVEENNVRWSGQWGIDVEGADANVCFIHKNNCKQNGIGAYHENSFLGCMWTSNHSSGNGIGGPDVGPRGNPNGAKTSFVTYPSGTAYFAVNAGTLNVAPGTGGSGWELYPDVVIPTSAEYPLWTSPDAAAGNYFVGGSFVSTNPNSRAVIIGNYTEEGESPAIIMSPSVMLGGINRIALSSTAPYVEGNQTYGLQTQTQVSSVQRGLVGGVSKVRSSSLGGSTYGTGWFRNFYDELYGPQGWQEKLDVTTHNVELVYQNSNSNLIEGFTGPSTTSTFGRSSPVLHARYFDRMFLGGANGRQVDMGSVAPTTGEHGVGDFVFNNRSVTTVELGWICITAGAPGTWQAVSALPGYVVGQGGAVTQATSKSTGVTLNKLTGSITLDAASLAANTAVSFTLTNSLIASRDTIQVSIRSSATAGAYVVQTDAVGGGSCQISLRNMTGGALAEAVVINYTVLAGRST